MDDLGLYDCPMPVTFREKLGMTAVLAWLYYLGFVTRVLFGPLMPAIQKDLGFAPSEAGLMFLMMSLGYMVAPVCSGYISSRMDHLGTLKFSALLLGAVLVPLAFVETGWQMGIGLMVIGFAGSLHLPSAVATITAEIQKNDWGKGLAVHQTAPPMSFVSAPLLAALLLKWLTWREILLCWAALALLSALLYMRWGQGGTFQGRVVSRENAGKVMSLPSFWILVLLLAMAMAGNSGIFAMLPMFFVAERGFDLAWANTLIGFSQLSGLAVVFFAGIIADRIGQEKIMAITLLGTAVLTLGIGVVKGWLLIVMLFLQPAILTAFFPAAFAALSRVAPPALRSVTSAVGPPIAFLLGAGAIPSVIGYLAESFSYSAGIVFSAVFMMSGPLLIRFIRLGDFDSEQGC